MKMTKPQNDILSGDWMLIWIHFGDGNVMLGIMPDFWLDVKCIKYIFFKIPSQGFSLPKARLTL